MSVISLPRREFAPRPESPTRSRVRTRPAATTTRTRARHATSEGRLASISAARKSVIVIALAVALCLLGSMFETNRQVQLHELQSQVLQQQSAYAVQVGSLTNLSAPSVVVSQASALHLVNPLSVTQVPATSLDATLPLPTFSGYAPVTSRTQR